MTSLICTATTTGQTIQIALTLSKEKGRESDVFDTLDLKDTRGDSRNTVSKTLK